MGVRQNLGHFTRRQKPEKAGSLWAMNFICYKSHCRGSYCCVLEGQLACQDLGRCLPHLVHPEGAEVIGSSEPELMLMVRPCLDFGVTLGVV